MINAYAELHCHSNFSLLDAASSPEALVECAHAKRLHSLALTDHDSLAGAIRFWKRAKETGVHAILGAEVTLVGNHHLTLLAENQPGYANLCRLLTESHLGNPPTSSEQWPGKGEPALSFDQLEKHHAGLIALSGCRQGLVASALMNGHPAQAKEMASQLVDIFGRDHLWVELQHHALPDDDKLVCALLGIARSLDLPYVATQDVHYATQAENRLRDALIAIRHLESLKEARRAGHLPLNTSYYLASSDEMAHSFQELPKALQHTVEIADRCNVSLDFSNQRLPAFPTPPGLTEFAYLYQLCHQGLPRRYPDLQPNVLQQLTHELAVIDHAHLAGYFLIVWDIIRFAREHNIRCQGRGSAANSIVAYLLGITSIDPIQYNLLFERFLSADRFTIPDIDIDFAADEREQVIQYVYEHYGASHAAMVCNINTYRARSAVRDLGKALDFPLPVIDRLAKSLDAHSCRQAADELLSQVDNDTSEHPLRLLADLLRMIEDCPRHLSIHVGGMLITSLPLDEVVPLERATMPGRVVAEWNKDSVEDSGLIKIDLLSLRTLGLISEALRYIEDLPDLDALSLDDPEIYAMLQRGDTLGTFQVESRAQVQMIPRLKPERFEDIVVQIAIVRPGPIQGGAVHPYLRRRAGLEPVSYLHPCLEPVLSETLGVLLFQEQAIKVAMVAANFSPGEADMLRRALARSDAQVIEGPLRGRFVEGAQKNGIDPKTAEQIFEQLAGFAGYGFCKSHSASFALIAYQTLHLKRYYPSAFYCALLNQQPMGFYDPEVIIGDMKRHGIGLLPPDVNKSVQNYIIDQTKDNKSALRMGLITILGLGTNGSERILLAREAGQFMGLCDFCMRTRLPRTTVSDLIRSGALDAFDARRKLLWELGEIDYRPEELAIEFSPAAIALPELSEFDETRWEYELLGLSPNGQVMRHYRAALQRAGVLSTIDVKKQGNGKLVRVGGMAVVKQRPATAKGILFVSLEDEQGLLDLIIKPNIYERYRSLIRGESFLLVEGTVQQASGAVSVLVSRALEWFSVQRPPTTG